MKRRNFVNAGPAGAVQERVVYGIHAIAAWIEVEPRHLHRIHYTTRAGPRVATLIARATEQGVAVDTCSDATLQEFARTPHHQGIVARARAFPYGDLAQVVASTPRLLILADHIQDPQNLGALIRTAAAAGAGALLVPKDASAGVTASVEAAAAGAAASLPVCRITNAARTLGWLKERGYWVVGLVPRQGVDLFAWKVTPPPLVVVVGGEAGMRRLVTEHCDLRVSIPMPGPAESLNASVAAGIVIYEILRNWQAS
jgi:23S rRNA (guanosine2251-2'-O)-methyltransferase